MLWLILGISTALFFALVHIASKYAAAKADTFYLSNTMWIIYSILSLPLVISFFPELVMNTDAFLGFVVIGLISFSTNIIYLKSLRHGDISKTVPLLSITPVFTLIIALFWLGEFPKINGIFGIIFIVTGTYFLNLEHFRKNNVLEPLLQVFKDRASRLMLLVAVAYGLGSVTDKFIINHSNPLSRVVIFSYFTVFFNTMYLLVRDGKRFIHNIKDTFRLWKTILLIDVLYLLMLLFQMYGLSLTYTAYIIALKRTSAVFSVVLAYLIFNERRHFYTILAATLLMAAGIFLMAFF